MKYIYYLLVLSSFFVSCNQNNRISEFENATTINIEDFSNKSLHGTILDLEPIWNPHKMYLSDSILFLINQSGQTFAQTFNLNTNSLLTDNVPSGAGPNDFTSCVSLTIDKTNDIIEAFDPQILTIRKYRYSNFITQSNILPIESFMFEANGMSLVKTKDYKYVGTFAQKMNSLLSICDSQGHFIDIDAPYPKVSGFEEEDFLKKFTFLCSIRYNEFQNKLVLSYGTFDVIDVYDTQLNLLKRIHGPYFFYPGKDKEKTETFFSTALTSKYIYALFSGHLYNERCKQFNTIFVFDYDLNPIVKYELDIPISNLVVDEDNKILYGLSDVPERCVVKFELE